MTFCRTNTPYCQQCVELRPRDQLRRVLIAGKPYWLCSECRVPFERSDYEVGSESGYGHRSAKLKGRGK